MVFDKKFRKLYQSGMSRIRKYREDRDWTQKDVAEKASTSQPQIKRLESGEREMTQSWAERLAPVFGVTPPEAIWDLQNFLGTEEQLHRFLSYIPNLKPQNVDALVGMVLAFQAANGVRPSQTGGRDQPQQANPPREEEPSTRQPQRSDV